MLESQVWQGIFLPEPAFSAYSLTVCVQPVCVIACISICEHVMNPKTRAAGPLFGHMKILHTMIGVGSAALAAVVPYSGKATNISCNGP